MRRRGWTAVLITLAMIGAYVAGAIPGGYGNVRAQDASPVATPEPAGSPAATPVASTSPGHVIVTGRWWIDVVSVTRAAEVPDLELDARSGRDWIVVIADISNWSGRRSTFKPSGWGIRFPGQIEPGGFGRQTTEDAADALDLEPRDIGEGVGISSGDTERMVFVFRVDSAEGEPTLMVDDEDGIPLQAVIDRAVALGALPAPAPLPELTDVEVDEVPDGGSLTLDNTLSPLSGVDAPAPAECYGGQSTRRLERLAGEEVKLEESSDGSIHVWIESESGVRTLINREMLASGAAALAEGYTGPYLAWMAETDRVARASRTGLWSSCTSQHGVALPSEPQVSQIRLRSDGENRPYTIWVAWAPLIITKPDGSAWVFFSAEANTGADRGNKRLYASKFDPATDSWSPAEPMPGGKVQMGPSAVVDADGLVHLVYCDRAEDEEGSFSEIVYTKEDGRGGWTDPVRIAPEPTSGFQLSPSLAISDGGTLHVAWQDQRAFDEEGRTASAANADIFVSDLKPGEEAWSKPVLINIHYTDAAASRPHIVADGDRLVAVWSVYATSLGLNAAARIEWSTRSLDDELDWTTPQPLVVGRGESFGGRLLDLQADPTGGVVFVYGRQATDTFLFMRRLKPGASEWGGDTLITYGTSGTFPSVTVSDEGVVYITYNAGDGSTIDVGAVGISYRSIEPGPEVLLTVDQPNTQGRPIVATDLTGRPWIIYFSEPDGGVANEVRVLRNAEIPLSPEPAADDADSEE